ncbi:MAG TPA: HAMP domain-containing sensor histidine kinase [Mobilitalea sp.]|nr:HAMP domain-containing sensor histidine kinase [Mobilitalea sp.]
MNTEIDNDTLACLVKENPILETAMQNLLETNKKTTTMFIHELRNPLSLIKGTLQYIETKHPETKDFKYWDQLQDLVRDLELMMSDASLLNSCSYINKEPYDLLSLIIDTKNNYMPQAITQQVDLTLTVEDGSDEYFKSYSCDSGKLKQVMSNLVKNALEATLSGGFINIRLSRQGGQEDSLPKLAIQISNNGLPIQEDNISKIFLPFYTNKKGGIGIGLALVSKIIQLHYGSISVSSDAMLTSFTILLPL